MNNYHLTISLEEGTLDLTLVDQQSGKLLDVYLDQVSINYLNKPFDTLHICLKRSLLPF